MNRETIYDKLTAVFREVFDNESIQPCDSMTAKDVDSWDSLSNIRMIVALEETLGISFSTSEITDLANVGALVDVIEKKMQ